MDESIEELFAFYALGTLTAAERARVEAYLASNPDAKGRLDEMIRTVSTLPYEVAPMEPSAALKEKVVGRVRADAGSRPAPAKASATRRAGFFGFGTGNGLAYAVAALSLLLAAAIGGWALGARNEVAQLKAQVAVLQQELVSQRAVLVELSSPDAKAFAISGTEHQPQAQGQLIANSKTGSSVLVVSGLKPLAEGTTYEFWLIKDSAAAPGGLFKVNEQGVAVLQVTASLTSNSYNAIGVSVEPAGGSQKPTGDIVMLGKLN